VVVPGRLVAAVHAHLWLGIALMLLPGLAGCLPPQASYSVGLSTSEIVGDLEVEDPDTAGKPLILVYEYHYLFVQLNSGDDANVPQHLPEDTPTRLTASLAHVLSDGSFSVYLPTDVVKVEMFFISPDRLTEIFQFQKQLGVGRIVYHARLKRMPDWRSHFYTYLIPELEHVIAVSSYDFPVQDQAVLASWIGEQRKRMEALRKPKPGAPAPPPELHPAIPGPGESLPGPGQSLPGVPRS
jgi:hypothetical protein